MTSDINLTQSGTYWDGGPVTLTESITARNATAKTYNSFIDGLREQIERTKIDLDATLAEPKFEKSFAILEKKTNECQVADLETIVNQKASEVQEHEREQKIKDLLRLQYQAASFIVELKSQIKDTQKLNRELKAQVEHQNILLMNKINGIEKFTSQDNMNMANRLKMTKMIGSNPPPKFDHHKGFGTADGLLAFLNEDLNEYFEDMCIIDKSEKCRLILKIFGSKSEDYKCTTRRFFMQETVHRLIRHSDSTMRMIYKELVHFLFVIKPKGKVGKRRHGESLTNYLTRWFTVKDYCGIPQHEHGKEILRDIFEKPEILDCRKEIIREIKAKFFVTYANDEIISKGALLGFAQRLDMLYAEPNEIGIHAIGSYEKKCLGMMAIDQRQMAESENRKIIRNRQINGVTQMISPKQNDFNRRCYNCNSPDHIAKNCLNKLRWADKPAISESLYNDRRKPSGFEKKNTSFVVGDMKEMRTCFICSQQGHIASKCWRHQNQNKKSDRTEQKNWRNENNLNDYKLKSDKIINSDTNPGSYCALNEKFDSREYVKTTVTPDKSEKSLLDTGAMINAISTKLVEDCGMQNEIDRSETVRVELTNEESFYSVGTLTTFVEIAGRKYLLKFHVVPGLNPNIIYGTPFLEKIGILHDFRKSVKSHLGIKK